MSAVIEWECEYTGEIVCDLNEWLAYSVASGDDVSISTIDGVAVLTARYPSYRNASQWSDTYTFYARSVLA